jgi:integrase
MARGIGRLPASYRNLKPGMHCDGGGLYLQITEAAGGGHNRSWVFRYTLAGRVRDMGVGSIHTVSLGAAREQARHCRRLLLERKDPIEHREAERAKNLAASGRSMTFDAAAEGFIRQHRPGWRNVVHAKQWASSLKDYASPVIGDLMVADITTTHIMRLLDPIWTTRPETASRVRSRIESILDWAKVSGCRDGENVARWRGHLDKLLPAPAKVRRRKHHAAMPYAELPAFLAELRQRQDASARALEFLILTAARTNEVRQATAAEFDTTAAVWTVPADHMKGHREHRVPLSAPALALVDAVCAYSSKNAMGAVLAKLRPGSTVHGFRSSFRDWAAEQTNYPREVCEAALAHAIPSAVEAAYRRTDLFDKRRALMTEWARFLGRPQQRDGKVVVPIRAAVKS